jgi:hypothetical protein
VDDEPSASPAADGSLPSRDASERATGEPTAPGLWPSPTLMRLLLVRTTEDIARRYALGDEQRAALRESMVRRWAPFLHEHRADIQPVLNEFIEMRLDLDPPTPERVQAWAKAATPVLEALRGQVERSTEDFRRVVPSEQRTTFEVQATQLALGMSLAERKLARWRSGEVDPREIWKPVVRDESAHPAGDVVANINADRSATSPEGAEVSASPIAAELSAWDAYVERFIVDHRLDDAQRDAARSCLGELKARAIAHCDRRRDEITRLEDRIRGGASDATELAGIKAKLIELYGPVDEMFAELKERVEQIPTSAQRQPVLSPANPPTDDTPGGHPAPRQPTNTP